MIYESKSRFVRKWYKNCEGIRDKRYFAGSRPKTTSPIVISKYRNLTFDKKDLYNLLYRKFKKYNNKEEEVEVSLRNLVILVILNRTGLSAKSIINLKMQDLIIDVNRVSILNHPNNITIYKKEYNIIRQYRKSIGNPDEKYPDDPKSKYIILSTPPKNQAETHRRKNISKQAFSKIISSWTELISKSIHQEIDKSKFRISSSIFKNKVSEERKTRNPFVIKDGIRYETRTKELNEIK